MTLNDNDKSPNADFKIKNPEYVNDAKISVMFDLVKNDKLHKCQFSIPKDDDPKNEYWEIIKEEYGIEYLDKVLEEHIKKAKEREEWESNKREVEKEAAELRELFHKKSQVFKIPFIKQLSFEKKSLIRRAQDVYTLNLIYQKYCQEYMDQNSMDLEAFIEYLEDAME